MIKENKKKGFTLVELLAVIVILAIILVIAVPKVMDVINDSKKATLESTAKMIASAAEKAKVQNTVLGKTEEITCDSVAKVNDLDYEDCNIAFDDNTAKVTIKGSGKFEGLYVCSGTKTIAVAQEKSCTSIINMRNFADDDWETIVLAVKQAEIKGTEYPYQVGSVKTLEMDVDGNGIAEEYLVRVANKTKCSEVENSVISQTACGFVLEFENIINNHVMNPSGEYDGIYADYGSNKGGWPSSEMYDYVNETIYGLLPEYLRNGIIKTTVVSSHGSKIGENNFTSDDYLYLLSPEEVYGTSFTNDYDTSKGTSRQLDYYKNYGDNGVSVLDYEGAIKNYQGTASYWWLRSANSYVTSRFYAVENSGNWNYYYANELYGVSPAFRLAK